MNQQIKEFLQRHAYALILLLGFTVSLVSLFILFANPSSTIGFNSFRVGLGIVVLISLVAFWKFFTSDRRLNHKFTALHASNSVSDFYRIYFPIIILSIVIMFLGIFALLPQDLGGWGLLDESVSPTGYLALAIFPGIVIGLCLIVLSDLEMRKLQLLYAPRKKNMSVRNALFYSLPLIGLYFGLTVFLRFILQVFFGPGAIIPVSQDIYRIDGQVIEASRFWIFLTQREKYLTFVAFLSLYIGYEFIFRGLIGNHMKATGLGAGGLVFVPAIVEAFGLSSGNLLFSDPVYYGYVLFNAIWFGIVLGIILWRTGRFGVTVVVAIFIRFLDSTSDFQRTCLSLLPRAFGTYDPADAVVTTADKIGTYLTFLQIILIIFAPFIMLAAYNETWKVITTLYHDFKDQWFGYLVLAVAFFLIDMIFTYFAAGNQFLPIVGFILALFVVGFVLNILFKVLPQPNMMDAAAMMAEANSLDNQSEYPIDPLLDIKYLESTEKWYNKPKQMGFIASFVYVYLLFLSGAYRQYTLFNVLDAVKYSVFLVILPAILLGYSCYYLVNSLKQGYYFSVDWRRSLYTVLLLIFAYCLIIWTISGSLAEFSWRDTTFFILFLLVIFPKPIRTPLKDFSVGFGRDGRIATFNYIVSYPDQFLNNYEELIDLESDQTHIGAKIMASKLGILEEKIELGILRSEESSVVEKIASTFAIGIVGTKSSEGALLQQLPTESLALKIVSYWALGKIGSSSSLARMAQILEENPLKDLVPIAEKAILSIDPFYPLAGLRDNITFEA